MRLAEQKCRRIEAGTAPLSAEAAEELAPGIPRWTLENKALVREFHFKDFRQAMDFVNRVARLAEEQDHHPDILVSYSKVRLTLATHKIGGLSENDFILAAKIDQLAELA